MAASSDHLETMKGTQSLDNSEVFPIFPNYFYKSLHCIHIMLLLVFSVTPLKIDQNKNQNHFIDKVQNLENERK